MKLKERDIIERYGRELHEFVCRWVTCREDAEELVQDILVRALRSLDTYDERRATIRTWLWRIAWNEVKRYLARQDRRPRMVEMDEGMAVTAEEAEDSRLGVLEQAILKLDEQEQMLLQLRYTDGLSLQEISYVTATKATTLAVRLQRIRERLRSLVATMPCD